MPKVKRRTQNPDDDPAVRAAWITRSGTVRNGLIAAVGAVLVAVIGLAAKSCDDKTKPPPPPERDKLIVKVIDKSTAGGISAAKVNLEASGSTVVGTTDSEGVISFPIGDPRKEVRIRVDAEGYEKGFNLRVTPADVGGVQEVRLAPVKASLPEPSPQPSFRPRGIDLTGGGRSVVRGQVIDDSGAAIPGARVSISGHGSFVLTNQSGNFEIPVRLAKGTAIDLHVEKAGYRSRTQQDLAGNESVRVLLRRQ